MANNVKAVFDKEGRAYMVSGSGEPTLVPQDQLAQALQSGMAFESKEQIKARRLSEKYDTLGQKATAFGEGVASGASFGASDYALKELGADTTERAVAEPTSGYRQAGELTGAIAPIALSGGTGAVGALARLTPTARIARGALSAERAVANVSRALLGDSSVVAKMATRGAALATSGAIEGAAYSAGRAVSDAALGGTQLTAEKLLSAAQHGAVWGGATGGLLGAGGVALSAAGRRAADRMLGGKTLQEAALEAADRRAIKGAVGNNRKLFAELTANPQRAARLGERLRSMRSQLVGDPAADAVTFAERAKTTGAHMGEMAATFDRLGLDATDAAHAAVAKTRERAEAALGDFGLGEGKKIHKLLTKKTDELAGRLEAGEKISFSDLWGMRRAIDESHRSVMSKVAAGKSSPLGDAIMDMRRAFDDALTESIPKVDEAVSLAAAQGDEAASALMAETNSLKEQWVKSKEEYSDFITLERAAHDHATKQWSNRWFSPSDYGVGASGGLVGTLIGLSTGSVGIGALASLAGSAVSGIAHKYARERGSNFVATMLEKIGTFDRRVQDAAKRAVGLSKVPTTAAAVIASDNIDERFNMLREQVGVLTRDPEKAIEALSEITGELALKDPALAQEVHTQLMSDATYLQQILPTAMGTRAGVTLTPFLEEGEISEFDKKRALEIADALNDPAGVLDDLARGHINYAGIDALMIRRPQVFQQMQEAVIMAASEAPEPLEFRRRTLLSVAFHLPGDWSLVPQNLLNIQSSNPPAPAQAAPTGGGGSLNLDPGKSMQPTQPMPPEL